MKGLGWTKSKAGLAGILLLASVVRAEAVSQNGGGHTSSAQGYTKPQDDQSPSNTMAVQDALQRIAAALETANNKKPSKAEQDQARRNLQAQEKLAFWAPGLFAVGAGELLVTLIGIFLVWRTLIHTRNAAEAARDSVKETRRIGEAQTRAYLTCCGGNYSLLFESGAWVFICRPAFRNTGQTPAQNPWTKATLEVYDGKKSYLFACDNWVPTIAAGQTESGHLNFEELSPEVSKAVTEVPVIRISAKIYWRDIFGQTCQISYGLSPKGLGRFVTTSDGELFEGDLTADNATDSSLSYDAQEGRYDTQEEKDTD